MVQLNELFGDKNVWVFLQFFLSHPSEQFSQGEVISRVSVAKLTGMRALGVLEKMDIVHIQPIGRTKLYKLNEGSFVRQLKRFVNMASSVVEELRGKLSGTASKIIIFGSFARGEDREDSDIDVLVVTDLKDSELQLIGERIGKKFKRRLSLIGRTQEEFITMASREPVFWNRILSGETIEL